MLCLLVFHLEKLLGGMEGETHPNDEILVIYWAIFWLLVYLLGSSECLACRWSSLNAYFFSGSHILGLKLVFTCNTLGSCKLKLCNCF